MNRTRLGALLLGVPVVVGAAVVAFRAKSPPDAPTERLLVTPGVAAGMTPASGIQGQSFSCGSIQVYFQPNVPGDNTQLANQEDADCFAWQEFIALNWPSNAGATGFGQPGDVSPVQWQTYMDSHQLFQEDAAPPPAWGTSPPPPTDGGCAPQAGPGARPRARRLVMSSKFTGSFLPTDVQQAAPRSGPNWLGAQNQTNVWYEILVNQDEYQAIVDGGLYDATKQEALAAKQPLQLPVGYRNGPTGAIELKAAWMEADDPTNPRWSTFKLSPAEVVDPTTGRCRSVTLALVGLHIIHKTGTQNDFFWATFEHRNNAPDNPPDGGVAALPDGGTWNFYDPACQPRTVAVPASCLPDGGVSPVQVGCVPNRPPPWFLRNGCPGPVPIQVTRMTPLDRDASTANGTASSNIARIAGASSVWQNYMLVNMIWNSNPAPPLNPNQPLYIPGTDGGVQQIALPSHMQPAAAVANTTLETYAQNLTCTDCHLYATTAPTTANPDPRYFSDFSFLLGQASSPPDKSGRATLLKTKLVRRRAE